MRLAFFSPFPPKQTGVAAYSQALVAALRARNSVTAFDHGNPALIEKDVDAIDFRTNPESLSKLAAYDVAIYSLGNNPHYHLEILRVFLRKRGVLLLHDVVLYYLFAGLPPGLFYKHFCGEYGLERAPEIDAIRAASANGDILRYQQPERYPFLRAAVRQAKGIVVHSQFAAAAVRALVPETPVHVIPHLALTNNGQSDLRAERAAELRKSVLKRDGQVLLGTFGFLGAPKRLGAIRDSILRLNGQLDVHLVIVGEGPDPIPDFAAAGLADRVTWLRYVPDEDYDPWIEAADIVLNLRFPSMGETSGTLTRAMGLGKPCIVTNHATFAEFPDETVLKIPHGAEETPALVSAITRLAANRDDARAFGQSARAFVETQQSPDGIALALGEILAAMVRRRAQSTISKTSIVAEASLAIRSRIEASIAKRLPAHLQAVPATDPRRLPQQRALRLTAAEVTAAYQVLLGRNPVPDTEIPANLARFGTLRELCTAIRGSEEYRRLNTEA